MQNANATLNNETERKKTAKKLIDSKVLHRSSSISFHMTGAAAMKSLQFISVSGMADYFPH